MATYDVQSNPTPGILRAICTRLRARADLEGVNISRHDWDLTKHRENIIFFPGSDDQVPVALGNMRMRHTLSIKGQIMVVRDGNTEEVADECMDRAYGIFDEMEREFRGKDAGHVLLGDNNVRLALDCSLKRHDWDAGPNSAGTAYAWRIDFELSVTADTHRI